MVVLDVSYAWDHWVWMEELHLDPSTVHGPATCAGEFCVIHRPSNHGMRSWPAVWRNDAGIVERICLHGIGHPDPDCVDYIRRHYYRRITHGCDGCCRT